MTMAIAGPVNLTADGVLASGLVSKGYVDAQAKTFLPVANGTHFNGNGGATATAGLIQTRCRQTRKLLRVIAAGANVLQVEWANIWTSNTPQGGNASCEIAGQQSVTARMTIEYPAGNPRQVSASTAYSAGTAYALLDQVTNSGASWVCIQAGTGQTPAAGSAFWRQVNRYVVNWDIQTDTSGTVVFAAGDYRKSLPVALLERTRQGDCIAVLGSFDTGSSTGYLPYAGASGASNTVPFVDWVLDSTSTGLPAVGSALCDTGVTTQTNGNTTTANSTTASAWMKIPYATAITGNIPNKTCIGLFGDSLIQGTGGDVRDGEPCGIFPRSLDGVTWWRIAQGGNRAGCYAPDNAPWQMSVVQRCSAVVTNLGMNDINAGLTTAQVKAVQQTLWTMLNAACERIYAGYPTPISASSDAWATTANQSRFTNAGAIATTQNPTDDASYLTSVYGLVAMWLSRDGAALSTPDGISVQVGQRGHPLEGLIDWRSLIADPITSWKWNVGYTTDGAHPIASAGIVQAAYTAPMMEPVIMGRPQMPAYRPPYRPVGEPPLDSMPRSSVTVSYPVGTSTAAGTVLGAVDVSPGRLYYGFRCASGTATAASRNWTLLIGADGAKLKPLVSGSFSPASSSIIDTPLPGAPLWIPANYEVYVALTYAVNIAAIWSGQTNLFATLNKSGIGFVLSGISTDTAVLSATAVNAFAAGAAGAGAFLPVTFRPWIEVY